MDPISMIVSGVGNIVQGAGTAIAANQEAKTDDICGKKPGMFANKDKKQAYEDCMAKASQARIDALNARIKAESESKAEMQDNSKKWIVPLIVGIVVIALIVTTIVIIRRKRKK
jgi:cobalamin biosynthesis Mg chelatase CobN